MRWGQALGAISLISTMAFAQPSLAQSTVRIAWYSDGNEGEVLLDLLKRFEANNPDIKVVVDQVPFKAINETLPVQLAAGQGPDMARVIDLGGVSRYTLDLRPYLKDPAYWEKNFGPFLIWMRARRRHHGHPRLHDPAHRHRPVRQQDAVRAGRHRDARGEGDLGRLGEGGQGRSPTRSARRSRSRSTAPVTASSGWRSREGAKVFDAKGEPAIIDDGFKATAQKLYDWHKSGVMSRNFGARCRARPIAAPMTSSRTARWCSICRAPGRSPSSTRPSATRSTGSPCPIPAGPAAAPACRAAPPWSPSRPPRIRKAVARVMDYLASEEVLRGVRQPHAVRAGPPRPVGEGRRLSHGEPARQGGARRCSARKSARSRRWPTSCRAIPTTA